jgi:tetratricopeptide (TPR) repeat protein
MNKIPQLLTFLETSPNDAFLTHALALEYSKIGEWENAMLQFENNLSHHPNYVATYYHLGKLLESQQKTQDAIKIYELGMEIALQLNDRHAHSELRSAHEDLIY